MHTANLLELLLPELLPFILKYLPEWDLKNSRSINNIWEREANHVLSERMKFQMWELPQGNYTVKKFYSKLQEYNICIGYPEDILKMLFLGELSPENTFKVHMDGLLDLALDEIVKRLSSDQ